MSGELIRFFTAFITEFFATFPTPLDAGLIVALIFIAGSIIGSFINVVAYRLPMMLHRSWSIVEGMAEEMVKEAAAGVSGPASPPADEPFNLVRPRSRCPRCQANIKHRYNIPLLGYFLTRGVCATCKAPVSTRYPVVEWVSALLTVIVIMHLGLTWAGLVGCILTWVLLTLTLIDQDTRLLPDQITLPMIWLGLMVNLADLITSLESAVLGACFGYLFLWGVYHLFRLVTGKEGMGYGDFKMLAMLGAWLGWEMLPLIILISSFSGALTGGVLILLGRDRAEPMAFGPWLAMAGWVALLWGQEITAVWSGW